MAFEWHHSFQSVIRALASAVWSDSYNTSRVLTKGVRQGYRQIITYNDAVGGLQTFSPAVNFTDYTKVTIFSYAYVAATGAAYVPAPFTVVATSNTQISVYGYGAGGAGVNLQIVLNIEECWP